MVGGGGKTVRENGVRGGPKGQRPRSRLTGAAALSAAARDVGGLRYGPRDVAAQTRLLASWSSRLLLIVLRNRRRHSVETPSFRGARVRGK